MISDIKPILMSSLSLLSKAGFSIGVAFENNTPSWTHSSYSKEWIDHYVDNRLLDRDPTILHGQKNCGHWSWGELERLYPGSEVFSAAKSFGLTEGNTVSICVQGLRTIASCSGPRWSPDELKQATAAVAGLHMLHVQFAPERPFSDRAADVLRLMAAGLQDREIAEELRIKPETVRQRRSQALQRTDSQTHSQLISLCIKNGWV